jgi:hypothetical protein
MNSSSQNKLFATYDRALSPEFCRNIIERFENDPRKSHGLVGEGNYRPDFKGTIEMDFNDISQGWQDVVNTVDQSLKYYLRQYMQSWSEAFQTVEIHHEGFRMARYDPGQQFDWHSDNIGDSYTRVITALWYLNTVEEGGETEYKWMDAAIKPVEGRLMLCPVGWPYYHRGAPPVSGPKYTIITQLHQQRRRVQPDQAAG